MQLKDPRDFWAGAMFTVIGAGFAFGALNYSFGSSARPGPAYFPFGLGILMALLGLVILLKSVTLGSPTKDRIGPIAWRPLLVVVLGIESFALTLPLLGIAVSLPLLVIIISAAGDQFRWRDVLINCAVLTVGSWAIFIKGLSLTLPLWPTFIG